MGESKNEATSETSEATQNGTKATDPQSKANIFEDRPGHKKIIRVVTVMAYLFSVSFVAIALSGYYVFIWRPPNRGSTYRAQTMSQEQAQYFAENLPNELPINNNDTNITEIYNRMNDFKDKISQNGGIKISSDKSNERILNSTSALVNPISTQMYQNKTGKVKTDTRTDIYGIPNGQTDVSVEAKNLETSTLLMRMSNVSESLTNTDLPYSTEQVIEEKNINSTEHWNFTEDHHIDEDQVFEIDEFSLSDEDKWDDSNQTETRVSTVDSVELSSTRSIESSNTRGYHEEKILQDLSQNHTELSEKLKDILPPLPIYIKERKILSNRIKEETFPDLSSTISSSNILVEEAESNNPNEKNLNQNNLPKR